ncbi:hypothetical protein MBLNU457_5168t1 [Dothideomycetes sp. NU457]
MTFDQLRLLGPLQLIALSAAFIPVTIASLVWSLQLDKLTSYGAFQHAWFGRFWKWFGPQSTDHGRASVEPLLKDAEGVVLDIGPGNGQWLYLFAAAKNSKITKIYGVEPNTEHHASLRESIVRAGLEGVYEILSVGAEDLGTCGIREGSIDTIATVQVLCSVPGPQKIIKALYPYLKPGGRWLVYEHIRTPHRHDLVSSWQALIDHVWPHFFDGCSITRPTDEWLLQAGEWESADLKPGDDETKYDVIPHAIGTLVKKR